MLFMGKVPLEEIRHDDKNLGTGLLSSKKDSKVDQDFMFRVSNVKDRETFFINFDHYDNPKKALEVFWDYFSSPRLATKDVINIVSNVVYSFDKFNDLDLKLNKIFSSEPQLLPFSHSNHEDTLNEEQAYRELSIRHYEEGINGSLF